MRYPSGPEDHLLIPTRARRLELLAAKWVDFDLYGRLWTIPRAQSKTDVDHLVPRSEPVCTILARLPRIGAPTFRLLFTATDRTPFSDVSKALDRLSEWAADYMPHGKPLERWHPHDLRQTFATGRAKFSVPLHTVEKSLKDTSGTFDSILAVYQRHDFLDERRSAMATWSAHLDHLTRG